MVLKKVYNQFNNLSPAKKSSIAFLFATFIQRGLSFLITPLFTRLLSTSDFGIVTVYNSWVEMIGTVAMLSLSAGMFNVGMMDYEDNRDGFTSALLGLSNFATVITVAIFYLASLWFPHIIQLPKSLFVLMFIYFIFQPATRFWMARQRFEYKYKTLTFVTIISALLSPTIGLIVVLLSENDLGIAKLWGTNSVLIVIGIVLYVITLKKSSRIYVKKTWIYALTFSIPLLPHYLAMHTLATSDRVMIQSMIGTSEAGLYGLGYTASMVICTVWTAIQGSLTPYVYEKLKKDELSKIAPVAIPCLLLFSSLCLVYVVIAPEVIMVLGGEKYAESVKLIPPLLASVFFMEMYNLFSLIEFYHKKTVRIMFATLIAAILNVGLNYFALKQYGYIAAAYTTLLCYILYSIFHYLNMKRIEPRKIYNIKFLLFYSLIYIGLCMSCLFLYPHPILRYVIIVMLCVTSFVKRKKIIYILSIKKHY